MASISPTMPVQGRFVSHTPGQSISYACDSRVHRPIKLTRRGRRVVAFLATMPVLLLFLAFGTRAVAAKATTPTMTTVVVQSGQSLWDIATELDAQSDPRAVIYQLQQINGLETSEVLAGQELIVPAR